MSLSHPEATALAEMGPSAWHASQDALAARISRLPEPMTVTQAVTLSVLSPRP